MKKDWIFFAFIGIDHLVPLAGVGRLGIKYRVETQEQAFVELSSRLFGHANVKAARGKFVFRAVYESGNLARAVRLFIAASGHKAGRAEGECKTSLRGMCSTGA